MKAQSKDVMQMIEQGMSHRAIAKKTGLALSMISGIRNAPQPGDKYRVLVIGDLHEPSCRKGYLEFCQSVYKKYRCNRVVFIGDVVDWHSISFFSAHPDMPGPADEYTHALQRIQRWYRAFPVADVIIGNHDARIIRLAETAHIPSKFLRNYADIWKTPKWKWTDHTTIDDVYYMHGISYGGLHPAFNAARHLGMSCVMGHIHSVAGVKWCVSPVKRWFGLDVGCGIDDDSMAFAYSKHMKRRSVISCGVVVEGQAHVELMPLEKYK